MRHTLRLFVLFICCLVLGSAQSLIPCPSRAQSVRVSSFEEKLDKRVEHFDASGRTLIASVLDLAYEYDIPVGLESISHDAATRPINFETRGQSVRGILVTIVQKLPDYRVSFLNGMVDIYVPKAREDPSNLLNKVIKDFSATELDTHDAALQLSCALSHELEPSNGCGGSVALGQWGALKITVHLQNAKVYEILNAIVAQNGKAIWTVVAPPKKLSRIQFGGLWHIYPLQPPFKDVVLDRLTGMDQ
jgi:hypothetical protein